MPPLILSLGTAKSFSEASLKSGERELGSGVGAAPRRRCPEPDQPCPVPSSSCHSVSVHQDCKRNVFTNKRSSCTMRLAKLFFKNMWAGPLSTTSGINNLLPGCRVDKLNSFHHLRRPHLLPSQTHATSPSTSKFISQTLFFLGGG